MWILACFLVFQGPTDLELLPESWTASADSAYPSWVSGADGELLFTRWHDDESAEIVLTAITSIGEAKAERVLEQGKGWFLNWADVPAAAREVGGKLAWTWLALEPTHEDSYGTRFRIEGGDPAAVRPLEEHRGPGEHGFVSLARLSAIEPDGRFLALWLDGREATKHGGKTRLMARVIGGAAAPGPETTVDPSTCSCCPTSLVLLPNGTHLAAWRDRTEDEVRDISVARFDGHAWSEPTCVHADGWQIDGCPVNGPRLAAGQSGTAVAWYTGAGGGSVLVARGDPAGHTFAEPIRVDDGSPEGRGDVVILDDGSLVVGWLEHDPEVSTWRVRRVSPDGSMGASLVVAAVSSERSSGFLRMTRSGADVLLAYTETEPALRVVVRRVRLDS